jgi:AraC-like DNA-binding protein
MRTPPVPRCIMLPPLGRPRWMPQDPAGAELLYLSWGVRWMGDHPIPLALHDGWVYAVILEGNPTLKFADSRCRTRPGDVFILHPDCAFGWEDKPRQAARMISWLWRNAPTHSKLAPVAGKWCRIKVAADRLRQLVAIHQHCLREVRATGETALLSLQRARLDLDICLARALSRAEPADRHVRLSVALHFLRHHPGIKHPVKGLCEHLNITPATLRALFQRHCRRSPQAVALDIRMHYAQQRFSRDKASVKEVAYELGYHHANDLSRAYREYFGAPARAAQRRTQKGK